MLRIRPGKTDAFPAAPTDATAQMMSNGITVLEAGAVPDADQPVFDDMNRLGPAAARMLNP